jgi:hypothetical protein
MTYYSIDDGDGNQVTTGLQSYDQAMSIAQARANRDRSACLVYSNDPLDDGEVVEAEAQKP